MHVRRAFYSAARRAAVGDTRGGQLPVREAGRPRGAPRRQLRCQGRGGNAAARTLPGQRSGNVATQSLQHFILDAPHILKHPI